MYPQIQARESDEDGQDDRVHNDKTFDGPGWESGEGSILIAWSAIRKMVKHEEHPRGAGRSNSGRMSEGGGIRVLHDEVLGKSEVDVFNGLLGERSGHREAHHRR